MSNERLWNRAQRYLADGQPVAARFALENLLQRDPAHAEAHLILGNIAWSDGRLLDAVHHASNAALNLPDDATFISDAAELLLLLGENVAARTCLEHALLAHTEDGTLLVRLASLRRMLGEHSESLAALDRAGAAGIDDAEFHYQRGVELAFNGRLQEAQSEHEQSLRINPTYGRPALALTRFRKQTPESNHLDLLAERIRNVAPGTEDHVALEFARYKGLEDMGRYDDAWSALARGNALMYARKEVDSKYAWDLLEGLIKRCTPQFLQPHGTHFEGPQPIFIFGMPRSGTTLLDRILSNHSQVASSGELEDFGLQLRRAANHRITLDEQVLQQLPDLDYVGIGQGYLAQTQWRAPGVRFFVDKLPRNWMVAGLIRRALPQARILNLVREPMDVCFSNFRAHLGNGFAYSYDIDALAAHYLQYRRVLAHWQSAMPGQILDVVYGDLVRQPEDVARKVFAFCGLDWEPGCVDLTRNKSTVATLSMVQVREPIHTRSFEEWRPYEQHLTKLRETISG
ncbi:sulfotransferase [Rhodanobacter sp. MP7CTX1]|uniref:tetratricopeptide repeat-containing sulfotransferase family protein n=1 Tax=Rhodanobacter sp. MP7CTX1 TaxID=2723084 RepID=UPI001607DA74|nr:sulfotransferase [Rhodanobacter sp. MP7CTX1]MBB6189602.1 tetratricopeptide (TPR) repeat protein [Rhodanobacter sp. MP7CTX1]